MFTFQACWEQNFPKHEGEGACTPGAKKRNGNSPNGILLERSVEMLWETVVVRPLVAVYEWGICYMRMSVGPHTAIAHNARPHTTAIATNAER